MAKTSVLSNFFNKTSAIGLLAIGLFGCSSIDATTPKDGDKNAREREYRYGSLASDEGGISVFGGKDKKTEAGGITVNAYLWRAALDTVAFMPIANADPFGGVILTDWYSDPAQTDERIKLNVFILDRDLRADGVSVKVFKQKKDGGNWVDTAVSDSVGNALEDTILTRARQLRLKQKNSK